MSLCVQGRVSSSLEMNRSNRQSAACWLRLLLQRFVFDCDPILQLCTEIVENRSNAVNRFRFRRPRAPPAARAPDHRSLPSAKPRELFRELDPIGARPHCRGSSAPTTPPLLLLWFNLSLGKKMIDITCLTLFLTLWCRSLFTFAYFDASDTTINHNHSWGWGNAYDNKLENS